MVKLDPNTMPPSVTIILVSWNTRDLLRWALRSVRDHAAMPVHMVVVDNASSDGSPEMVRAEFPEATLIVNPDNRGFGQANNQGFAASDEPLVLLLNSDAELTPGALPALVGEMDRYPNAGVVGARLVFPNGRFQASFADFPTLGRELLALAGLSRLLFGPTYPSYAEAASGEPRAVDWVGGACMLLRREAVTATGGFDPGYHLYSEEMDLCRRIRQAGFTVRYQPSAVAVHHGGQSSTQRSLEQPRLLWESRLRYYRLHRPTWEARLLRSCIRLAYLLRGGLWRLRAMAAPPAEAPRWRQLAAAARSLRTNL